MSAAIPFAQFAYTPSPDQGCTTPAHHPVIIVGAGPVGLSLAIDLAQRGTSVVLLDDSDRIGDGSRAICFAKRTLEIFDRLGVAKPMLDKGVSWQVGKVFQAGECLYQFDLLPEPGHKMPAFINLQQFYVEKFLIDRALALGVDLRWKNRVVAVRKATGVVHLTIETPDGCYDLAADHVVACDGARSPMRSMLGLSFAGEIFEDQFLIADVRMQADLPVERWFWFDPPFHSGQSCLLHKQPDDVWRIDLQLSPDADPEHERQPAVVRPRIERMLGHQAFELEWVSIYRFQCRRLERFRHGRVIFAGDAAHQVSPFGARGANSGIQDADNLGWKLALVMAGASPDDLLVSYDSERSEAADENILNSTRATDFIAPRSLAERFFRNAALALARTQPFARRFVNSGRLSLPTAYARSSLSTADTDLWPAGPAPGAPIPDAPLGRAYLGECLNDSFLLLAGPSVPVGLAPAGITHVAPCAEDILLRERFDLTDHAAYLIRPDGHVAARFRQADQQRLEAALKRARGVFDADR
ncbi:MAG: FAD-dependent oxidoreductase [Bosea sp. (in: a-proteobacteria)]